MACLDETSDLPGERGIGASASALYVKRASTLKQRSN
jgi:hypothetical protein